MQRQSSAEDRETERRVIGVADFDRKLKRAVETTSGRDWIQGEVSGLKRAGSGHTYFTLRDEREEAAIDCVMYRFQAQRARRHLVDGALLQVLGKATVWAPRGRLQLVAEVARPAGRGAQLEALERLKKSLAAEGLFERERKRPLPSSPTTIGVITSAHGAAWHDIRTVALRRAPVRLILSAALVQGEGAQESLLRALRLIEKVNAVDALIIGRGGGSAEDLMAFNEERLVRAVAACAIPTVSAVGHEVDTTLCDLVADARAATPSEAAELVVPDQAQEARRLGGLVSTMSYAMQTRVDDDRAVLERLRLKLSDPRFVIAEKQQLLDEYQLRLERALRRHCREGDAHLNQLRQRLTARHPRTVVATSKARLAPIRARLEHVMAARLQGQRARLGASSEQLQALSPLSILGRGYSIVLDERGQALRSASQTSTGAALSVRLANGSLDVVVNALHPKDGGNS